MKILLFTLEYPPFKGGVSKVYENIIKHWPEHDSISVLNNNCGELINNNLPVLKWLPAIFELKKNIKLNNINHVLVGQILPLGTATYILSKFIKIKYSVFLHGMDLAYALKNARKKKLAKKILNNSENIICFNAYTADIAKKIVKDEKKITVVNPGVDRKAPYSEELVAALKKKHNLYSRIRLLSLGRLVKRKGHDKVLESLPAVNKEIPNLSYVIAGTGPEEAYLKSMNYKSGNSNVIFLGKITDEEKWVWLNLCDIFIMPARNISGDFEGFGIVYLEANLAGKPVIAGRSGGVEDAVVNGVNGILINNPEDVNEIAGAIVRLAKDKNLRDNLGEKGKERAIKDFNWRDQTNKIFKIIKSA